MRFGNATNDSVTHLLSYHSRYVIERFRLVDYFSCIAAAVIKSFLANHIFELCDFITSHLIFRNITFDLLPPIAKKLSIVICIKIF